MRIYISGLITWDQVCMGHFAEAQKELERLGHKVINPAAVDAVLPELEYEDHMKIDFAMLELCDAIYMLDGWEKSRGANREYGYAIGKGLEVLFENGK